MTNAATLLQQGVEAAHAGHRREARDLFLQVVEIDPQNELAWMWLTGYVDDLEDKIVACENVLTINPANDRVRSYLSALLQQREALERDKRLENSTMDAGEWNRAAGEKSPAELRLLAEQLEQDGKIEEAITVYERLASKTKDSETFDYIYKQIIRLEGLKKENIQHVAPSVSLLRMSFTWVLVYVSFVLMQVGLKPFANFSWLWLGVPFVVVGNFFLALSEVQIKHVIWQKVFLEDGHGSSFARGVLAVFGWVLVILPFVLVVLNSLARLSVFQIPPEPFF